MKLSETEIEQQKRLIADGLSNCILKLRPFFSNYQLSNYQLENNSSMAKGTIKKHFEEGIIPPEYIKTYLVAMKESGLRQAKRSPDVEIQNADADTLKAINDFLTFYIDALLKLWDKQECIENFGIDIVGKPLTDKRATENFSPLFAYRMNKCFDAFSTITVYDYLFLKSFYRSNEDKRHRILECLNRSDTRPALDILMDLTTGEGRHWIKALSIYSSSVGKKSKPFNQWRSFTDKVKSWADKSTMVDVLKRDHSVFILQLFVEMIWPERNATDTNFGAKEIQALIAYKYFLTEDAQKTLQQKFCEKPDIE